MEFKLHAPFQATGDQPEAIARKTAEGQYPENLWA